MAFPIVRTDFDLKDIVSSLVSSLNKEENLINNFEDKISLLTNKQYSVFFPKLRFGMEATFRSLFENQIIGVPTYTCSVVPHSVAISGNKIKFFDSNSSNLTTEIYPKELDSYIVTPWYGSPLDLNLDHIKYSFGDFSHINLLNHEKLNKNNFYATFYSFGSGKPLSSIGGGVVSTNDKNLYKSLTNIRNNKFNNVTTSAQVSNITFGIVGSFIDRFNLESIKIKMDNMGALDFLREPINEISLGKFPKRLSAFQVEMLIRNIEKDEDNSLEIKNFWRETLEIFPIKILNSNNWSNSHLNIKTNSRNSLQGIFNKLGIQASTGVKYLNHDIEPYKKFTNEGSFVNSIDHLNNLLQLPINLSDRNFLKLLRNKDRIQLKVEELYS